MKGQRNWREGGQASWDQAAEYAAQSTSGAGNVKAISDLRAEANLR